MYADTIAAIATGLGEAALGVVRVSGPDALAIGQRLFSGILRDRRVVLGALRDPATGEMLDQAMGTYLAPPRTYTREPMVEFSCHGSAVAQQAVLEALLAQGARLAGPGEFTLRAFLNGRIDLAEAESVLDIIQARSRTGLQVALRGVRGRLSQEIGAVRAALLEPLAYLTALVDFPEDEVGLRDVTPDIEAALSQLERLIEGGERGIVYRQGVRAAIVGKPNAGKSSLLNRMLGEERAIVTPVPGTTRDTVEESVTIRGVPFVLIDTAGIRRTSGPVEGLGVERSRTAIAGADLVLFVIDASRPRSTADRAIERELGEKRVLAVTNKRDLPQHPAFAPPARWPAVDVSAATGEGIERLEERMAGLVLGGSVSTGDDALVANPRHLAALRRAGESARASLAACRSGVPPDLVTVDLTAAVNALGEVTGENVSEDLLHLIFSRFCIGK